METEWTPRARSLVLALLVGLVGAGTVLAAARFLATLPEPPPGDGFAAGLAAGAGLLFGLCGILVVADAVVLAAGELLDRLGPRRRLAARLAAAAAALGPVAVAAEWLAPGSTPEAWGAALCLVAAGTAVALAVTAWTVVAAAVDLARGSSVPSGG